MHKIIFKLPLVLAVILLGAKIACGQVPHCNPKKVLTAEGCVKCHSQADAVWKATPHFRTFATLHKSVEAKTIASKMGAGSIKRGDLCIKCHYTQVEKPDGKLRAVSGVSCESCHGAGKDWVPVHNDYGGPGATKDAESPAHALKRLADATKLGMRNPHNLYSMAKSCLGCHTVPNEKLVNVGGQSAGSLDFEMVSWSQGTLRHNFLRTGGKGNAESDENRLRVMWVSGLIAELEYSTRAVALATKKEKYGLTVAKRAADAAMRLYRLQQTIRNPHVEKILNEFAKADLKINNGKQLESIANVIESHGLEFASGEDGSKLAGVDQLLPAKAKYK